MCPECEPICTHPDACDECGHPADSHDLRAMDGCAGCDDCPAMLSELQDLPSDPVQMSFDGILNYATHFGLAFQKVVNGK